MRTSPSRSARGSAGRRASASRWLMPRGRLLRGAIWPTRSGPDAPDRASERARSWHQPSSLLSMAERTLIVDWDGTITERDSLLMVLEQFGDWEECERLGEELFAGKITLREEIERQFATVHAPQDEVVAWAVENVRVRPGLPELAALHPLVVSSGFHELIDPVLEREGVQVELQANRIEASLNGWRPIWRELPVCSVCGQPCKRSSFPAADEVVYVGDGYS